MTVLFDSTASKEYHSKQRDILHKKNKLKSLMEHFTLDQSVSMHCHYSVYEHDLCQNYNFGEMTDWVWVQWGRVVTTGSISVNCPKTHQHVFNFLFSSSIFYLQLQIILSSNLSHTYNKYNVTWQSQLESSGHRSSKYYRCMSHTYLTTQKDSAWELVASAALWVGEG